MWDSSAHVQHVSLKLERVPQLWKTSCMVSVPKIQHPKDLNSYRPVALTSHLIKSLEAGAYPSSPSGESILALSSVCLPARIDGDRRCHSHRALSHQESTLRSTFFDLSSAFNTIHPRHLKDKLECTIIWQCGF